MGDPFITGLQAVIVSLATVALLAILRGITPSVRWDRQLKAETAVYAALPEGPERNLWSKRVEAQAERLRLYRENLNPLSHVVDWSALVILVALGVSLCVEAANGWPGLKGLTAEDWRLSVPFIGMALISTGYAVTVSVRLILGYSTSAHVDGRGRYPKMLALREDELRRRLGRIKTDRTMNVMQARTKRAKRDARAGLRLGPRLSDIGRSRRKPD